MSVLAIAALLVVRLLPRNAPSGPPAQTSPQPAGCPEGCIVPPPGCEIKGNISLDTGERIYHLPGQKFYEKTVISPGKGERWFCSEEEARVNGWRRSKR